MNGHFVVKKITNLEEAKEGTIIPESDYSTLTSDNRFVQMEFIESTNKEAIPYPVDPGIYTIVKTNFGLILEKTEFSNDKILSDFVNTKDIENKADCFFRNVHRYKEFGIDVAKRAMLLYGPPGTGKSAALGLVSKKYVADGKTAVVIFPTDQLESYDVKEFIKTFAYNGVEKLILIMEDIGGLEKEDVRIGSDSGLLALLDNQEKAFKIPTLIISTTNYIQVFMGNLTNRPGRFDDKIEVGHPNGEARVGLFKFFCKDNQPEDDAIKLLATNTCKEFSAAHIKEIIIRSVIHEKDQLSVVKEMIKEIEDYKKAFSGKEKGVGFQ